MHRRRWKVHNSAAGRDYAAVPYKGRSTLPQPLREGFIPYDGSEGLCDAVRVQFRSRGVNTVKDDWKAVMSTTSSQNPSAFREALANAGRVGFVFESAGVRGHGVYANGPARFTILAFEIR